MTRLLSLSDAQELPLPTAALWASDTNRLVLSSAMRAECFHH